MDAGGFGLAILIEGFVAAALQKSVTIADVSSAVAPLLHVLPVDDWDDQEYLYCTEFLLFGEGLNADDLDDYVSKVGGSELVVGGDEGLGHVAPPAEDVVGRHERDGADAEAPIADDRQAGRSSAHDRLDGGTLSIQIDCAAGVSLAQRNRSVG